MKNKLLVVIPCAVALALSLACGAAGTPSATEIDVTDDSTSPTNPPTTVVTPPPAAVTTPVPATGASRMCVGSTTQGYPITVTMTVTDTVVVVTQVQFGILMIGSGWKAETTRTYRPVASVRDGHFEFHAVQPGWEAQIDGVLNSQTLKGTLWVSHAHPQGFGTAVVETPYTAVCAYHGETG
jgi:hypothetical protein